MSNQSHENFNLNLLHNAPAEGAGGEAMPGAAAEDGSAFAAQLAGGGGEFVLPSPKKTVSKGMIAFAVVTAVAAGGLWWMNQRTGGPAPAEAADPNVDAARASIQQFLSGGTGSVVEMKALLADSGKITEKFATYNDNHQVPLEELKTNPFFHELDEIEQEQAPDEAPRPDLSRMQQEERARREAERQRLEQERLTAAAAKLEVQTVFYGRSPTALIDGKICRVGQQLGEFTIVAIRADAVEVRGGEHVFEVKLKR